MKGKLVIKNGAGERGGEMTARAVSRVARAASVSRREEEERAPTRVQQVRRRQQTGGGESGQRVQRQARQVQIAGWLWSRNVGKDGSAVVVPESVPRRQRRQRLGQAAL